MTYAAIPGGMYFPYFVPETFNTGSAAALSTATAKVAMIGRVYLEDRAGPKTIDTTSSSAIQFKTGSVTFAHANTDLSIGLQDVATGVGPFGQPDGTFDVSTVVESGAPLTANAWQTVAMTGGTKTLTHGQLIAVVWDLIGKGGADTIAITPGSSAVNVGMPYFTTNLSGAAWLSSGNLSLANCVITFNDGTLGYLDFAMPMTAQSIEAFRDADNPDERALVFQVPWNCKVDALWGCVGGTNISSTFNLSLYSDPLGTPASMVSTAILIEQLGITAGSQKVAIFNLSTEQILTRNTDYAVAVRATGTTSTRVAAATLADAAHRTFYPGGTTLMKGVRDNDSGAFGTLVSTHIYQMGIRISQFDDGTGSGSGTAGVMYNPNLEGT